MTRRRRVTYQRPRPAPAVVLPDQMPLELRVADWFHEPDGPTRRSTFQPLSPELGTFTRGQGLIE